MDFEEYQRRILGDGMTIDLSINTQEVDKEAILLVTTKTPTVRTLKRLQNELLNTEEAVENENTNEDYVKPIYLKLGDKEVLAIGKIEMTLQKHHHINSILMGAEPRFYTVSEGVVGEEITKKSLVHTIQLGKGRNIHEYI